jgi:uncharacterized membrane protein (GlpM family)
MSSIVSITEKQVSSLRLLAIFQHISRETARVSPTSFGRKAYIPYQVYLKAIYEYFRDDLDEEDLNVGFSVVELSELRAMPSKRCGVYCYATMA